MTVIRIGAAPPPFSGKARLLDGRSAALHDVTLTVDEAGAAPTLVIAGPGIAARRWPLAELRRLPDQAARDGLILALPGDPVSRVMLDPVITDRSDATATHDEGCLSIPGVPVPVTRPVEITLGWTDLDGQRRQERLSGFEAICAQHEYDHLDGILITDALDEDARAARAGDLAALTGGTWTPVS